ncbi:KxYKxGKxW signal peptide domain-containing protein [Limosilactobacillus caviae]
MEIKKHFKLYKSGKQWVTAAVATVALSTGMILGGGGPR